MGKLIRMDLYRMFRSKSFFVCLILTFVFGVGSTPLAKLLYTLAASLSTEITTPFLNQINLSAIISDPFPLIGLLMVLLSLCYFFYADAENGYIKNIAGQMPMKGFTILSKFIAAIAHNLIFAAAGIIGNLLGTLPFLRIAFDADVLDSIRVLVLRLLLLQSITALLLLVVAAFRSKSLGMILAVLFGFSLTGVLYGAINQGLAQVFGPNVDIVKYMPDMVMGETPLDTVKALLVAIVSGTIFLIPAIRVFDRKDVK